MVFLWRPRSYPTGNNNRQQQGGPSFHTYPSQESTAHWDPETPTRVDHTRREWTLVTFRCWCFERFRSKWVSHNKYLYSGLYFANSNLYLLLSVPVSSSSGYPLCHINRAQPSGPQQAVPKSAPTHRQNIKSKHDLSEFCLTKNWSECQSPHKAVKKNKVHQVLEQRFFFKRKAEMCTDRILKQTQTWPEHAW